MRQRACAAYLDEHAIDTLLQSAVAAMLDEFPDDPKRFVIDFFEGLLPPPAAPPGLDELAVVPLAEDATDAERMRSFRFLASSLLANARCLQGLVLDLQRSKLHMKRKITSLRRERQVRAQGTKRHSPNGPSPARPGCWAACTVPTVWLEQSARATHAWQFRAHASAIAIIVMSVHNKIDSVDVHTGVP